MAATPSTKPTAPTRSHLIHLAAKRVPSRFELVKATARCARLFHTPNQRIGESINQALEKIADPVSLSAVAAAELVKATDELLIASQSEFYEEGGELYEVQQ